MKMKKIIKKWGSSLVIRFNPDDVKIYDLKEGDTLDIEIVKLKEKCQR